MFLIENMQTRRSRHQFEKKKQVEGTLEVTQDQTLKMCLFRCRQISLTKTIQTFSKTKLSDVGAPNKLNCKKCEAETKWSIEFNPNQA